MTKQAELRGLLEQVVGAEGPWETDDAFVLATKHFIAETLGASCGQYELLTGALQGDMNAALAFKDRMLPGWRWARLHDMPGLPDRATMWVSDHVERDAADRAGSASHPDENGPALALLAAVLKCFIEQESEWSKTNDLP